MEQRRHYRTLVLSDIHLGTSHSKTEEVSHFLSHVDCDRLRRMASEKRRYEKMAAPTHPFL